jgi:hypothetical protein
MKLTIQDPKKAFTPITLTMIIESREEAETLFELGNRGHRVEELLKNNGAPSLPYDAVLTYFYNQLDGAY